MITGRAGTMAEAFAAGFPAGLIGTLTFSLEDGDGNVVTAPRLTGIRSGPGYYNTDFLLPADGGTYLAVWDPHSGDPEDVATEEVVVSAGAPAPSAPPEALDLLALKLQSNVDPVLSDAELATLLATFALPDASMSRPGDTGWVPTYDVDRAAAEGWRWKAGRVSDRTDIADEAAQIKRSQLYEHCMAMAASFDRRATETDAKTITTTRPLARFTPC